MCTPPLCATRFFKTDGHCCRTFRESISDEIFANIEEKGWLPGSKPIIFAVCEVESREGGIRYSSVLIMHV